MRKKIIAVFLCAGLLSSTSAMRPPAFAAEPPGRSALCQEGPAAPSRQGEGAEEEREPAPEEAPAAPTTEEAREPAPEEALAAPMAEEGWKAAPEEAPAAPMAEEGSFGNQTTNDPVLYQKEGIYRYWQLFGALYYSGNGVTARFMEYGIGVMKSDIILTLNGMTYVCREAQIPGGGVALVFSGNYWYEFSSKDASCHDDPADRNAVRVSAVLPSAEFYVTAHSRELYSGETCKIRQASMMSLGTVSRRVYVYLNDTLISDAVYLFPDRGIDTDFIQVYDVDADRYSVSKSLDSTGMHYVVRLAEAFPVTGSIDNGGAVTNRNQQVFYGKNSEAMVFTPATAYRIVGVSVNGSPLSSGWSDGGYTFPATAITQAITVHAATAPVTYTLCYDSHGGTPVPPQSYTAADALTLAAAPGREGYRFCGWRLTLAEGNWEADADYAEGEQLPPGRYGNVTLTAQWEARETTVRVVMHVSGTYADLTRPFSGALSFDYHTAAPEAPDQLHFSLHDGAQSDAVTLPAGRSVRLSQLSCPAGYELEALAYSLNGAAQQPFDRETSVPVAEGTLDLHLYLVSTTVIDTGLADGSLGAVCALFASAGALACAAALPLRRKGRRRR